jgi:hypothetical protein
MASEGDNYSAPARAGFAGFFVFAASFCLYALTASPAIGWLDAPEFVAQATTLGVAHSPGHPLPALLGHWASLVPIGDLVWRINLMSGLCAAGTVTLLFVCGHRLLRMTAPGLSDASGQAMALLFALLAAVSWALWSNAVRAEVYALQALLSAGALVALVRYAEQPRARDLLLASFLLALGLANHHLMALFILLPAALFVLLQKTRPGLRASLWTAAIGLLGLCALAYIPIRSMTHPEVNFGAPHTLERFLWTLRGDAWNKSVNLEHASTPFMDSVQVLLALGEALTLPLLLLALVGAVALLRNSAWRRLGLLIVGSSALCVCARVLLGFDPETPDHHAYLLPAILCLYLLALAGLAQLCTLALEAKRPLPKAPPLACVAIGLLLPIQLAANWEQSDLSSAWASDDLAHWESDALAPNSLLLLAYFETSFRFWALHAVEGARPDVATLDRSFLTYPGMAAESKRRYPDLKELIDAPLRAGEPSPLSQLNAIAAERPIAVQMHINVDTALASSIYPSGAFANYVADPSRLSREELDKSDQNSRDTLARLLKESTLAEAMELRKALTWHDAMRLDQYCFLQHKSAAARVYADARQLAPKDTVLLDMARRCGLEPAR